MDAGKCGSCQTRIVWALTVRGKKQPLNAVTERRIVRAILPPVGVKMERRIVVVYDAATGEHRAMVVETWPVGAEGVVGDEVDTYMPHHATCPRAGRYRKRSR